MGLNVFFTSPSQTSAIAAATGKPQTALGNTPLGGLNFFEFLLARLNEATQNTEKSATKPQEPLQSDNPLLDKNPKLSLADILAANPEIKKEIDDFIEATQLGSDVELSQTLALNQQALDEVLKPVVDTTPGTIAVKPVVFDKDGQPLLTETLLLNPENISEDTQNIIKQLNVKIQKLLEQNKPVAINLNLTPEQITALQNQIADETAPDNAEWPEELSGFIVAFVQIPATPPPTTSAATTAEPDATQNIVVPVTIIPAESVQKPASETAPPPSNPSINALAAKLNALTTGEGEAAPFNFGEFAEETQALQNAAKPAKNSTDAPLISANAPAATKSAAPAPNLAFLQNWPVGSSDGLWAPFNAGQDLLDNYGLSTNASGQTSLANLTSLVTQTQSASTPHPALQLVAVNIQKAFAQGQDKTLMLQLDPPDLGRVEVRMTFSKDKTMKAHLVAEKPETYLMLQRDSQTLERTLESAGINTDGGLSFELAGQDQDFGNGKGQGGGHNGQASEADEAAPEIIQSTMTWHVDPETGHTRYNLLV